MFGKYISSFSHNILLKVLITMNLLLTISSFAQAEKTIERSSRELSIEDTETYSPPPGTIIPRGTRITATISVSIYCVELEIKNSRTGRVVSSVRDLELKSLPFSFWTSLESGNYTVKEKYKLVITGTAGSVMKKREWYIPGGSVATAPPYEWEFPNAITKPVTFEIFSCIENARVTTALYVKVIPDQIRKVYSGDTIKVTAVTTEDISPGKPAFVKGKADWKTELSIIKGTGTIEVTTNLPQATFSISGPASYSGSAGALLMPWRKTGVPAGTYTITYGDVSGYTTPQPETDFLWPNNVITFNGIYLRSGTIIVTTNLAQATFSISGLTTSYTGSGTSWTKTGVPAGAYTIRYGDVSGYTKPASETKTLAPGGTITFSGTYLGFGTIVVTTNLAQATFSISGLTTSYTGSGTSWTKTGVPAGAYTIRYGDVSGYIKPASQKKTLVGGGTITFSGTYDKSKLPHSIMVLAAQSDLSQNFPNPFNPDTWIPYQLKEDTDVVIRIYTSTGQLVRTLDLGYKPAGFYTAKDKAAYWDGKNEAGEQVASGVYFYRLQAGDLTSVKRMILTK